MKYFVYAALSALIAGTGAGDTTKVAPSIYKVDSGVRFLFNAPGPSSYTVKWTDDSGTYAGIPDPNLILSVGETYEFQRTNDWHPLHICTDDLTVSGTPGSYSRTPSGIEIDATTIYIADGFPNNNIVSWTPGPSDIGEYWYTCRISAHTGMTGKITIVYDNPPCFADVNGDGMVTPTDFTAWISAYNNNEPGCDQNLDELCTPTDFTAWIANFNAGC